MKENKNKLGNYITTISLIFLILVLIGLTISTILVLTNRNKKKQNTNNSNATVELKLEEENNNNETNPINNSNDGATWVYNGEYLKERTDKQKINPITKENYQVSSRVILPYININSEDAQKANNEISELFDKLYNEFDKLEYEVTFATYNVYTNKNILSVVLEYGTINNEYKENKSYITYNFNLNNLNRISYKDCASICGFASAEVLDNAINNKIESIKNGNENFANAVINNNLFYINDAGVFNIFVTSNSEEGIINFEIKPEDAEKKVDNNVSEQTENAETTKNIENKEENV